MSVLAPRRYALGRALAMVRERPGAFLLGVVLTASALALPLSLASIVWSVRPVLAQLQPAPELSVFVAPRAATKDVDALRGRLAAMPGVATVTLRPKDAAFAQLVKKSGFTTPPAELGANPLPDVLVAQLAAPARPEAIESLAATVRGWPLVDAVRSDLDWYRKVHALGRLAWAAVAIFGGVVLVLVGLILVGTVRLHAGTRSEEVAVLRLVGAAPRFIVRPYAYSATATLLVACGLALAFVYFTHAVLREPILQLTTLYAAPYALPDPEPAHVLAVLLIAAAFGWIVGAIGARTSIQAG